MLGGQKQQIFVSSRTVRTAFVEIVVRPYFKERDCERERERSGSDEMDSQALQISFSLQVLAPSLLSISVRITS